MKKAILEKIIETKAIDKNIEAQFLLEYQKSIFLELKNQGIINDLQCQHCIEVLSELEQTANPAY